jgi:DNA modification methylase
VLNAPVNPIDESSRVMELASDSFPLKIVEITARHHPLALQEYLPSVLQARDADSQKLVPAIAKSAELSRKIEVAVRSIPTNHKLILGDARGLDHLSDESVHLILTSPPYWTLKKYHGSSGQLGEVYEYENFLAELDKVWQHALRLLVPGGRLIVVVGDVCLSRRANGRHVVMPLHASVQEHCRTIGFDNLAPIFWHKISNVKLEVENGSSFLGKPYEPNAIIKNDVEFILFQRKPGGYRKPSNAARYLSAIPEKLHREWFQQIWTLTGASTRNHPAPFPLSLAERLVRMFSFVGDTILDPFMGTGTTNLAAQKWGRDSIGVEIESLYFESSTERLRRPRQLLIS